MSSRTSHKNRVSSRIASIIGGITSILTIGVILGFALSPTKNIPDDGGTLGGALKAMMGINWETVSSVLNTSQLGGIAANYYIQGTPSDKICTNSSLVTTLGAKGGSGLIQQIKNDGSLVCADQIQSGKAILRPILATIRDLDSSCYGQVTVTNASGSTYSPNNSDPVDIYEGDTITTTPLCAMASLYFIDHSIVRLAPSTVLALRSAGTAGGSGSTDVTLSEGELWARVFKPITDDSYFNVSTDESSVGVRGTSLSVSRKKPGTVYETKIVAVDTGLASATGQVAQLSLSGSTGSLIGLKLAEGVTIQKLPGQAANITSSGTTDSAKIYTDIPFTRVSTLADLADFDALKTGVGNLPTIAMTSGWLRTNDIWSGAVAISAPYGISLSTQKVSDEITRTEPIGSSEPIGICTTESTPPNATNVANYVGAIVSAGASTATISDNNITIFRTVESNTEIQESSDCLESTIIARIERYKQHSGDYKIKGLKVKNIGFRAKDASEGLVIGDLAANNGTINAAASSWKIQLDAKITTSANAQHLINIGSGSNYLRAYLSGSQIIVKATDITGITTTTAGITIPSDLTNIKVLLEKTNLEYKLSIYNENAPVGSDTIPIAKFPVPIQNIFVGKNYTGGQPWSGTINNIQITKS